MRHLFSKIIVAYCIAISTVMTAAVLIISARIGELSSATVATLFAFWGGELLLLCLKRMFADNTKKPRDDAEI